MNREIKFRGWFQCITGSEYWVYGYLTKQSNGNWEITSNETYWTVDNVGQFTGLKDELGNEIYEGDILDFPFKMGIAYVINDGFKFAVKSPGSEAIDYEGESVLKSTRVIGNIYQDSKLLSTN